MSQSEHVANVLEYAILALCSFTLGVLLTSVISARQLKECRASLRAHDQFISLVVDDVERSVERAASILVENKNACLQICN